MIVHRKVGELAEDEHGQTNVVEDRCAEARPRGGGARELGGDTERRQGGVHGPGVEQAGQQPVEGGVAEDVEGRHGVGREAVQVDGLELTLDKVGNEQSVHELLDVGERVLARGGLGADQESRQRDDRAQVKEGEVEQDRAGIFDDKHGAPADLGACKLLETRE